MNQNTKPACAMTLAEAIQRVEARTDIPHTLRRNWLHALHLYGRVDGRAPQIIRLDPAQSIEVMACASRLALGVSKTTLRNARSVFKSVLRELGILASARPRRATIDSPEWRRLVAAVSTSHHPHLLIAFMGFCDATSVRPDEVTSETLESYLVERIATRGGKNVRANVAEVARLWNRYGSSVPGWSTVRLALRPIELPRALPLTEYPRALQADIAKFLQGVAPPPIGQLFGNTIRGDDGQIIVRPILSPKTIEARRKGVRSLLWAAVETGTPIEQISSLDLLIKPETAERVLQWHFVRLGHDKPSPTLAGFLDTLTAIAAFKRLAGPPRVALSQLIKMARPKVQTEMSDKNAALLAMLEQRQTRKLLLESPVRLMAEARSARDGGTDEHGVYRSPAPLRGAWLAAVAAAIEIELHLPLRVLDLASLHLAQEIRRINQGGRDEHWHIALDARKNGRRVETRLFLNSAALVSEYVDQFRPLGPWPESPWLFPHRDRPDTPRPETHFSEAISEQLQRLIGVDMHVHAFRAFAALLIMEADPRGLEDIRSLLGHASFETAWRYYMRHNRLEAAARVSKGIEEQRRHLGARR